MAAFKLVLTHLEAGLLSGSCPQASSAHQSPAVAWVQDGFRAVVKADYTPVQEPRPAAKTGLGAGRGLSRLLLL